MPESMNDPDTINIRSYADGDEYGIARLMQQNFPDTPDASLIRQTWRWQFKNVFSKDGSVAVAEVNSGIAAHYAVMCFDMNYQDQTITGGVSTATVTEKSFRGRGLFTKLARYVYNDLSQSGCKIVFGFPNSQSIRGFTTRLNWFNVCPFPLHIKFIRMKPVLRKILGNHVFTKSLAWCGDHALKFIFNVINRKKKNHDIIIRRVKKIPEDMKSIWSGSFASHKIAVIRNRRYLEWRYLEKPFVKYKIYCAMMNGSPAGYFIIGTGRKYDANILFVMEMVARDDKEEIYKEMLDHLDIAAKEECADAVSILIMSNNPMYWLFVKKGYLPVPRILFPQGINFSAMVNARFIDKSYVKNANNWYISWGDLDVV
ncbi:MAG TPA: GNAT family N-acetyltransferase [Smithella sp.]|nr:GNAT family N-acetyltransferase [Smithella sp.]